jgi:hypothetical protein
MRRCGMTGKRYFMALAVLVFSLAGCATAPDLGRRLDSYSQHYVQFDAVLAWDVRGSGSETIIDGKFKNVRYQEMDNVEVWVEARNAAGKRTARAMTFVIPLQLRQDDSAPFTVKLPVSPVPGTKLHFTYKYLAIEAGDDGGGSVGNWMQGFDATIP